MKADTRFLGLDIGTSAVKGLLIDATGNVVAHSSTPLSLSTPHRGLGGAVA